MQNYFVNIECPIDNTSPKDKIMNKFDYTIKSELYEKLNNNIPIVYNFIYNYYLKLEKNKRPVSLSFDSSISAATITAINEKYMYLTSENNIPVYKSNMKIIYLDSVPDLRKSKLDNPNMSEFLNSIVWNLLSTDKTFTGHKLVIDPDQIIYVGLNENLMTDNDSTLLSDNSIIYYTLQKIRKMEIDKFLEHLKSLIGDSPVFIVFDTSVLNIELCPCTIRNNPHNVTLAKIDGILVSELSKITNMFSTLNIVGLDVTGFDLRLPSSEPAFRITCGAVQSIISKTLNIKEKKINIFNEHSRFLIWKSMEDIENAIEDAHGNLINKPIKEEDNEDEDDNEDNESDKEINIEDYIDDEIGWYILKGVPLDKREKLLEYLSDGNIKTITMTDDDGNEKEILVTSTTIAEQEEKSYYHAKTYLDCVLFPEEKTAMVFELLNTPENNILCDK
jgi:arginase family enzyme